MAIGSRIIPVYGAPKQSLVKRLLSRGKSKKVKTESRNNDSDDSCSCSCNNNNTNNTTSSGTVTTAEKGKGRASEEDEGQKSGPVGNGDGMGSGSRAASKGTTTRRSASTKRKNTTRPTTVERTDDDVFETEVEQPNRGRTAKPPYDDGDRWSAGSRSVSVGGCSDISCGGGGDSGGGGCVLGTCLIAMADGSTKPVSALKKGDLVAASPFKHSSKDTSSAEVSCLISFKLPAGKKNMVRVPHSGLVISPTHPIRVPVSTCARSGAEEKKSPKLDWIYPSTLANPLIISCDRVYNIILSSSRMAEDFAVTIGGIQVSSLGSDGDGSFSASYEKVVNELKRIDPKGFEQGTVELGGMRRDHYGRVCGFFPVGETGCWSTPKMTPKASLDADKLLASAA